MSHNNIGWLFQTTERLKEAEAAYAEAVAIQKHSSPTSPTGPSSAWDWPRATVNLGNLLRDTGRPKEAEAAYAEALAI